LEYYELKARQQELQKSKPSKSVSRELERVAKRLQNMDLAKLSALTGISVGEFKNAVRINDNINLADKEALHTGLPAGGVLRAVESCWRR
ncbi:hypothetical protein KC221_23220, partial [Mycobacterium tuberculosis]|nr:hypothetical protein [Mycobacterium tuberculosis]